MLIMGSGRVLSIKMSMSNVTAVITSVGRSVSEIVSAGCFDKVKCWPPIWLDVTMPNLSSQPTSSAVLVHNISESYLARTRAVEKYNAQQ